MDAHKPAETTNTLRLVRPTDRVAPKDVLPFERRRCDRKRMAGRVTGVVLAEEESSQKPTQNDRANKIAGFMLGDRSDTGLGLFSQEPVSVGDRLTVFLPPCGAEPGEDATGRVVRCDTIEGGHWIGVELSRAFHSRTA